MGRGNGIKVINSTVRNPLEKSKPVRMMIDESFTEVTQEELLRAQEYVPRSSEKMGRIFWYFFNRHSGTYRIKEFNETHLSWELSVFLEDNTGWLYYQQVFMEDFSVMEEILGDFQTRKIIRHFLGFLGTPS